MFRLRVVPWWTDGCTQFLNNMFKWLPHLLGRSLNVLEFGSGNSTLYFLDKGAHVTSVENDDGYIEFVSGTAKSAGFFHNLTVIKAKALAETDVISKQWDIVVNDGISRREVLEAVSGHHTIVVLDNVEYCANWGRLDRGSAKPDLIAVYRGMLRNPRWRHYIFEQPEGRDGRGSPDATGWEAPHRWATAVLWPSEHLLARLIVSSIGLPTVNVTGADDSDVASLGERCPFDWEKMQWLKDHFPPELDLKLHRDYE